MRILLANFSKMVGDSGGLAKVNVAFANEMARRGHTVTTVYSDETARATSSTRSMRASRPTICATFVGRRISIP